VTSFGCLTFLTDFGIEDGFVAACHGVAARIAPSARIIDITHLVPPGDVRRGAAVLAQAVPEGSKVEAPGPAPDPTPEPTPPGDVAPGASDHTPPSSRLSSSTRRSSKAAT
jgi:hypothetical protein